MYKNKIKAFTLIELIIVISIIGILMMASTIYLGGTEEKRKTIEGQGCANAIGGEINNFIFYTLTSKILKVSETGSVSPNFYIIEFTGGNEQYCSSGDWCNKINLSYSTSTGNAPSDITIYKTLNIADVCQQNRQPLKFFREDGEHNYIIMNKGFLPRNISNKETFYISNISNTSSSKALIGNIIIGLCLNKDCSNPKQIGKFVADARSQTISIRNCKYYDNEDPTKCKTREGCRVYKSEDPTICDKY